MKIYLLKIHLTKDGYKIRQKELEVKETAKMYISEYSKVHKSKILKISSMMLNHIKDTSPFLMYHTYCLEPQIKKAKGLLMNTIELRMNELYQGASGLKQGMTKYLIR